MLKASGGGHAGDGTVGMSGEGGGVWGELPSGWPDALAASRRRVSRRGRKLPEKSPRGAHGLPARPAARLISAHSASWPLHMASKQRPVFCAGGTCVVLRFFVLVSSRTRSLLMDQWVAHSLCITLWICKLRLCAWLYVYTEYLYTELYTEYVYNR